MTVVVTDHTFGGVERERAVAESFGAQFRVAQAKSEEETAEVVQGARVVFVNFAPITRRVLQNLEAGAVVIRYGIGYDNVDICAATDLGIAVCNIPDYGADTVADHTVALALASLRKIGSFTDRIRSGAWADPRDLGPILGPESATFGLLGAGRIGLAVASRLRPFGFQVIGFDPHADAAVMASAGVELVTFDELLVRAAILSLHLPLNEQTRHILGLGEFAAMSPGSIVVNTSRGALIDEVALVSALSSGHLGGAALDVFEEEPLAKSSVLRELPNVLLTPHTAFYSETSLARLQQLAADEAERALRGLPLRSPITKPATFLRSGSD